MKIVSWNINSINARLERFLAYLQRESPDVVLLQEIKCEEVKFPFEQIHALGYQAFIHGQKTYNGVAILARQNVDLKDLQIGFNPIDADPECRLISATMNQEIRVVCAYIPNGQFVGSPKYDYKLRWLAKLSRFLAEARSQHQHVIIGGDFNVARQPIDVHDPIAWEGEILFSQPERDALEQVLSKGYADTFRTLHPTAREFSWWDYRQLSFPLGKGLRIDYLFTTEAMLKKVSRAWIDRNERKGQKPSDHAPVGIEIS